MASTADSAEFTPPPIDAPRRVRPSAARHPRVGWPRAGVPPLPPHGQAHRGRLQPLQTNATRLDDAWGAFLARHGFLVGVSLEGPRALHDRYRRDKAGRGSFDAVMRGVDVLRRRGAEWNALVTVHAGNAGSPLEAYRFLLAVFEERVRRDVGTVFVQAFDDLLGKHLGAPGGICVHQPTCGDALALEHTGDVYACDHYVQPDHRLGNLTELPLAALVDGPRQRAFGEAKRETLTAQCRRCPVLALCHGGCPKDRVGVSVDGEPGQHHLCDGYYAFFTRTAPAMRWMADAWRRGEPPAGVVAAVGSGALRPLLPA